MRLHLLKAVPFALAASFVQAQTLPEAMQDAVKNHPEIQAAINARIAADYQVREAQGGYLPKVDLLGGYGRESSDNTSTRAASNSHDWKTLNRGESTIRLQQNLFQGFGTINEVGRQQATANSRGYALLNTSERTALTVAQVYLDVLTRREMVQLAEDNLKSHERIFDQIKLRTSRGVGRMADMDQAEARLAQAQNNLITEQTNLADANTNYLSVVGKEPDQLERPLGVVTLLPASLEDARRQMIADSPVLRSAESDIAAAEKQYEAAKSTFYPSFDAVLQRSANNNASQQVPIAQQYVDRSTKVRTSYQQQFSLGERTLLDLLDSENELFTAQQRLAQLKSLYVYTQYRIKADMGQLLRSQGVVAPMASVVQNDIKPSVNLPGMN